MVPPGTSELGASSCSFCGSDTHIFKKSERLHGSNIEDSLGLRWPLDKEVTKEVKTASAYEGGSRMELNCEPELFWSVSDDADGRDGPLDESSRARDSISSRDACKSASSSP